MIAVQKVAFREILESKQTLRNLLVMMIAWFTSCFGYYLMNFYIKYIPGNIYENNASSAIAQFFGVLSCGMISDYFGPRKALVISFVISSLGGYSLALGIEFFVKYIPYFVFFAVYGVASSFHIGYLAN